MQELGRARGWKLQAIVPTDGSTYKEQGERWGFDWLILYNTYTTQYVRRMYIEEFLFDTYAIYNL